MKFILLITLIVFCTVVKVESSHYLIRDGFVYFVSTPIQGNWFESMRFCAYNRMHLIDVQTPFENERILSIINEAEAKDNSPKNSYWTSGNDLGHPKQFNWATSGTQIVWHDFDKGQPDSSNDGTEHCIHYWNTALIPHKWNDALCMINSSFICRATLDLPIVMAKDKVGWVNVDV